MNEQDIQILEKGVRDAVKDRNLRMLELLSKFLLFGVRLYESRLKKQNFLVKHGLYNKEFKK